MVYRKRFKGEDEWIEITKENALHVILGSYKDNEEVRGFLEEEGTIPCMFSEIRISKE